MTLRTCEFHPEWGAHAHDTTASGKPLPCTGCGKTWSQCNWDLGLHRRPCCQQCGSQVTHGQDCIEPNPPADTSRQVARTLVTQAVFENWPTDSTAARDWHPDDRWIWTSPENVGKTSAQKKALVEQARKQRMVDAIMAAVAEALS